MYNGESYQASQCLAEKMKRAVNPDKCIQMNDLYELVKMPDLPVRRGVSLNQIQILLRANFSAAAAASSLYALRPAEFPAFCRWNLADSSTARCLAASAFAAKNR